MRFPLPLFALLLCCSGADSTPDTSASTETETAHALRDFMGAHYGFEL